MKKNITRYIPYISLICLFVIAIIMPISENIKVKSARKDLQSQYCNLTEDFTIVSENGTFDQQKNTIEFVMNAFSNGAQCVQVDLVFSEEGVPYLGTSVNDIEKYNAPTLESVFKTVSSEDNFEKCKIDLNVKTAENLSAVDDLANKYNMADRLTYTGVSISQAPYVKSNSQIGFYIDYNIDQRKISNDEYIEKTLIDVMNSGAVGINCDYTEFSQDLKNLLDENWLKVSFKNIKTDLDLLYCLSYNPAQIITDDYDKVLTEVNDWKDNAPIEYYGVTTSIE